MFKLFGISTACVLAASLFAVVVLGPRPFSTSASAQAPGDPLGKGPLHTDGGNIVDADGRVVHISGVNWFGLETSTFAPQGLWARSLDSMLDQIVQAGFNTIRLPYSEDLFSPDSKPNGIDFQQNPDLQGLTGLQIMDQVIQRALNQAKLSMLQAYQWPLLGAPVPAADAQAIVAAYTGPLDTQPAASAPPAAVPAAPAPAASSTAAGPADPDPIHQPGGFGGPNDPDLVHRLQIHPAPAP